MHSQLLKTLENIGMLDKICAWFETYLRGRLQYVEFNDSRLNNYISVDWYFY